MSHSKHIHSPIYLTTDKQNSSTQTSLFLQQIWPEVPKLVIVYDIAVQQRHATRLPFCSAFPVVSWLCYTTLGSGEGVILPRGISDIEKGRKHTTTYQR